MAETAVWNLMDITAEEQMELFGDGDLNLKLIAQHFTLDLDVRDNQIWISEAAAKPAVSKVFDDLHALYKIKKHIETADVSALLNNGAKVSQFKQSVGTGYGQRQFYLRSEGQKKLYQAFIDHDITFAIGPAGTGKTFLAVLYACNLLKKGSIRKIIITRPVVEAGESLGFLPGDLKEKIDPYLRPIYDALELLFGTQGVARLMEKGQVEIAPLAYMRGRTLDDACVILDEAQNTTGMQLKMFMTRLGFNSQMIITGDITQIDLPYPKKSGLIEAMNIIKDIPEIAVIEMSRQDVVRHPVVQKIIDAYEAS